MSTATAPSWPSRSLALIAYTAAGLVFAWPLPMHLGTHVTGRVTGDTGVYLWNMWVFQHELLTQHQVPLFTSTILSLDPRIDLALHNYTVFADLLGLLLVRVIGLVATFNVVYLALTVMTVYAGFLLARDLTGRNAEAWLAGLLFAWSPALVARGTAHFSLVAAAPLPVFVLLLLYAERTGRRRWAMAAGLTVAWAAYCDPYYAVYCVLIALVHGTVRLVSCERRRSAPSPAVRRVRRVVDMALVLCVAVIATIAISGGGAFSMGGIRISAGTLYTPVLVTTVLVVIRVLLLVRPVPRVHPSSEFKTLLRLAPYAAAAAALALLPVIVAMADRIADGRYVAPTIFWRSSTPGVDLLAFFLPNPNNPAAPQFIRDWITSLNGGFAENVASLPWVALAVVAIASVAARSVLSRYWLGMTLFAVSLALGPFIRFAGVNTLIPTPWALFRYVPVIGSARAPARFTALVMMAVAMLFALALTSLGRARPARRAAILAIVGVALIAELWAAPRELFPADVPRIYDQIAADPRDVRLIELPFGIRDGLSSTGDFNASSQFYQSRHGKPLVGGYLSRVSARRVDQNLRRPVLRALVLLSQRQPLPPELAEAARLHARRFVHGSRLGYVVVDLSRASPELVAFATTVLDLEKTAETDHRALYRVRGEDRLAVVGDETPAVR